MSIFEAGMVSPWHKRIWNNTYLMIRQGQLKNAATVSGNDLFQSFVQRYRFAALQFRWQDCHPISSKQNSKTLGQNL
jgi:hypothetical protein